MRFTKRRGGTTRVSQKKIQNRGGNKATRVFRELGMYHDPSIKLLKLLKKFSKDPKGTLREMGYDDTNATHKRLMQEINQNLNKLPEPNMPPESTLQEIKRIQEELPSTNGWMKKKKNEEEEDNLMKIFGVEPEYEE